MQLKSNTRSIQLSKNWVHYLTRPMTIFASSLWHEWYASPWADTLVGATMPDALFVEHPKENVALFLKSEQFKKFQACIERMVLREPQRMEKILTKGLALINEAKKRIAKYSGNENIEESVDFVVLLGHHTANFPRMTLNVLAEHKISNPKLIELAEKIRAQTIYPYFVAEVIRPLAINILKEAGVEDANQKVNFCTYKEIQHSDFKDLNCRVEENGNENFFVYEINGGKEKISFSHDNHKRLAELMGYSLNGGQEIKGVIAYQGKITGRVSIIVGDNATSFSSGDVLVSVNSSPKLMPYIIKCSAIVTDEGGLGCHAAIVSREQKKPCIIGTKIATKVLKDGDMVEVDAEKGVVRKI